MTILTLREALNQAMTEEKCETGEQEMEMWINALRGHASPGTPPEMVREADLLRRIFKRRVESSYRKPAEQQVQRFLMRLHREGVLSVKRKFALFALVASLGFVAFGLALTAQVWKNQQTDEIEQPVMRGFEQAQRIKIADPKAMADRIEALLNANGLENRRVNTTDSVQLQAKIPVDAKAVTTQLTAMGITTPEHGRLDVFLTRP